MNFDGFGWIENGFQYGKIWILMGLDGLKMGFNMGKIEYSF